VPKNTHPDLAELCNTAETLLNETPETASVTLSRTVRELKDPDIRKKFHGISMAGGNMYYLLAREIAKEAGHGDWECPALKALSKRWN